MGDLMDELSERMARIEARLDIGQLPIRYAMAVDSRDVDTWLSLFVPDVQVGRDTFGREALRGYIEPALGSFQRSIHQNWGHRVELLSAATARGAPYCRAEHGGRDRGLLLGLS